MNIVGPDFFKSKKQFDLILVGSSFSSSFFLNEYLKTASPKTKVLVLEWGRNRELPENIESGKHSDFDIDDITVNTNPQKHWVANIAFGGNSNCWWATTPRMLPNDFKIQSMYGIGSDWPIEYRDLEDDYELAEQILQVSGPEDGSPFPKHRPYPQPPHRFTDPDRILKKAYPDSFFIVPTARARVATRNRPSCCATASCHLCPINAKFTVKNEMSDIYSDPRVTVALGAKVNALDFHGDLARGVSFQYSNSDYIVDAELVALGANAIMNPAILLRSGLNHPWLGCGLNEQAGFIANAYLKNMPSLQGSTSITGHGYMLYDGEHRKVEAACLIEFWNYSRILRPEFGRWSEILPMRLVFEDVPKQEDRVVIEKSTGKPKLIFSRHGDYTQRAIDSSKAKLENILDVLPVERIAFRDLAPTEAHILGTARMGIDTETSVVDANQKLHSHKNVFVLGGSSFVTSAPANPTLTICALALRSARSLT